MAFETLKLSDKVSLIQETGVANFMRCNIWHVSGRDFDLVIDTGMGLESLKDYISVSSSEGSTKPVKAIMTHCHFDHSGCLHEFDVRLGHRAEATIMENPDNESVVYSGAWTKIDIVDLRQHPDYSAETFQIKAAPLTGYLDEGDVIDLGDTVYQVLHLPGHSPGSIGLWDRKSGVLFSGDALYDGELLDSLYHSSIETYLQTLARLEELEVAVIHAGHFPSFGRERMKQLIESYRAGENRLGDVEEWFENNRLASSDYFKRQNWVGVKDLL